MNKGTLVAAVVRVSGLPASTARRVVDELLEILAAELRRGAQVRLPGSGSFGVAALSKAPRRKGSKMSKALVKIRTAAPKAKKKKASRILSSGQGRYRRPPGEMAPAATTHGSGGGRDE